MASFQQPTWVKTLVNIAESSMNVTSSWNCVRKHYSLNVCCCLFSGTQLQRQMWQKKKKFWKSLSYRCRKTRPEERQSWSKMQAARMTLLFTESEHKTGANVDELHRGIWGNASRWKQCWVTQKKKQVCARSDESRRHWQAAHWNQTGEKFRPNPANLRLTSSPSDSGASEGTTVNVMQL